MQKITQNYNQYYQGEPPKYSPGGSVDYSQLSTVFSRTPETMNLVYQYAPQISQDVSYIFDFSNQGAYGVYIPALVEEMKTRELKAQLESRGYAISEENGVMVAHPKDEGKSSEDVEGEIKQMWDQINLGKSEVLGVNINKVRSSTEKNMRDIVAEMERQGISVSNPNLLWDMLIMLELGATIVHEWEHSRGGDEGAAEGREKDFVSKVINIIKDKYRSESGGEEIPINSMSSSNNWYKFAQYINYIPESSVNKSGVIGGSQVPKSDSVISDWSMMAQRNQSIPIENRLGRGRMWSLVPDLSQEHDIIETQLRKQFFYDDTPDPTLVYEELLSRDRDSSSGYKSLEQLMEEKRPQPLMVPLEKTASKEIIKEQYLREKDLDDNTISKLREMASMSLPKGKYRVHWEGKDFIQEEIKRFLWYWDNRVESRGAMGLEYLPLPDPSLQGVRYASKIKKEATLFGWYNNLEISDGSTIPGLGDRVMAWDDRDEEFSEEESWIKKQYRYNPTYDLKGFYYRWIEPRFKPQLWNDMTQEYSNTHPAKRFANSESKEIDESFLEVIRIVGSIKDRIISGKIKSSRIIASEDLCPFIKSMVEDDCFKCKVFDFGDNGEELIRSIWIFDSKIPSEKIRRAEKCFQINSDGNEDDDLIEDLLGLSFYRRLSTTEIVEALKEICLKLKLEDVYIVGNYARGKYLGENDPDVDHIDITTLSPDLNFKLGQLLSSKLGVPCSLSKDLKFVYKGVSVSLSVLNSEKELKIISKLRKYKRNQLIVDLYKRDFTINMFAFNVISGKILDPLHVAKKAVREGVVRTYFDSKKIIENNPILILRAIYLSLKYDMDIEKDLQYSMIFYSSNLFKGKCKNIQLLFGREIIRSEGIDKADKMFDDFGLWKLKKMEI